MIRPYVESDVERVLAVWQGASRLADPGRSAASLELERRNLADVVLANARTWVLEEDGVVVGFLALQGAEVSAVFVAPECHGRGLDRALMDHARGSCGRIDGSADANATIWTLIQGAAAGDDARRSEFVERYASLVRRYFEKRWRGSSLKDEVEDGTQEVFLECLRAGGVLENVEPQRPGGFRAFLFGAIRNVARRHESDLAAPKRPRTETVMPVDVEAEEDELGELLDREWARCLMRQAAEHHARTALARGAAARQGVELLRLRFEEDLPIREIAARWDADPAVVHRRYRQAREEFRRSLRAVVALHDPRSGDLDEECRRLLDSLGRD